MAASAGACGGLLGTPGDVVNVRMQNDMKLPVEARRNYRHAGDGLARYLLLHLLLPGQGVEGGGCC